MIRSMNLYPDQNINRFNNNNERVNGYWRVIERSQSSYVDDSIITGAVQQESSDIYFHGGLLADNASVENGKDPCALFLA